MFELPVMLDPPSADIRQSPTEQAPSATKWVDNKKPIFSVEITSATTVHPLDNALDQVPHVLRVLVVVAQVVKHQTKDMKDPGLKPIGNEILSLKSLDLVL